MGKLLGDEFYTFCSIMSSDEDQPIVMDIYVGFTWREELAITVDCHNYEDHRYDCSTSAIVNEQDARAMARRHKVKYPQLPRFIADCMAEWREIINPECLPDEGCRFRITRTHGKDHSTCI